MPYDRINTTKVLKLLSTIDEYKSKGIAISSAEIRRCKRDLWHNYIKLNDNIRNK